MQNVFVFDLDDTLYDCTRILSNQTDDDPLPEVLPLFPDVLPTLNQLKGVQILLSKGRIERQTSKIKKLGLEKKLNKIIICPTDAAKEQVIKEIQQEFKGDRIWVIGDKPSSEIYYGNKQGCITVLKKGGRHSMNPVTNPDEKPTYTIENLNELCALAEVMTCRQ